LQFVGLFILMGLTGIEQGNPQDQKQKNHARKLARHLQKFAKLVEAISFLA
jgi:hypothetical protein